MSVVMLYGSIDYVSSQVDTTKIPYLEMSLEDLLNIKVISASKMVEKSSDAPATIHLITEDQIKTRGYTNLEEVHTGCIIQQKTLLW